MPGLDGVLIAGVPLYSIILSTMVWRAIARLYDEQVRTWSKLFTALGAISFAVSDAVIGVDRFMFRINQSQALVMFTYYAAQLGLALSVVDPRYTAIKKKAQ
ncbi:YhhN family [Popillia japonica]|uniref:lysoplasmalogenase n=1 Tax=Popillia japonica TaxID=7064 RepID=A0AAW1MX53_POPJA